MKTLVFVLVMLLCGRSALCLTNAEFYQFIKEYADGDEESLDNDIHDVSNDDGEDDDVDDVIDLPGGPDEEVDLAYLLEKIGFTRDLTEDSTRNFRWHRRHHHRRHHHHRRGKSGCHCRKLGCNCCISKRFKVKVIFKKIKFTLNACIGVTYLPRNKGFRVYFTLNGRRLFNKELSLKHPPSLCYGIPGFKRFAKICLEFYNIDFRSKRICARLSGQLDLKIKRFKVHLKIGCFRIPLAEEDASLTLLGDTDFLAFGDQASDDESSLPEYTPEEIDTLLPVGQVEGFKTFKNSDEIPDEPCQHDIVAVENGADVSSTDATDTDTGMDHFDETEELDIQKLKKQLAIAYRILRKYLLAEYLPFTEGMEDDSASIDEVQEDDRDDETLRFE